MRGPDGLRIDISIVFKDAQGDLKVVWRQRVDKVRRYLSRGDLSGLMAELHQFWTWQRTRKRLLGSSPSHPETEAAFWGQTDMDSTRTTAWTSAGDLGYWAFQKMCNERYPEMADLILDMMKIPFGRPFRGLVLGCGDMVAEYAAFTHPKLSFAEVDAYDVSSQSIERARKLTDESGLKVNYHLTDVNEVELPPNQYALIIVFHAFHHIQQVDHVAQQIARALLPGAVFYTWDYVGPRKLQFSERQVFYAQMMLQLLPTRYRCQLDGAIRQQVQRVSPDRLSPDEAIFPDQILSAIARHMDVMWQHNWAGLLYPLLEGIAFNFTSSDEDQDLLRFLFSLDYALCQAGEVEPNFTITLATKRQTV